MANNDAIFNAVIAGATGGTQARWIVPGSTYNPAIVVALATAVDNLIAPGSIDPGQASLMQEIIAGVIADRFLQSDDAADYADVASAIVNLYNQIQGSIIPGGGGGVAQGAGVTSGGQLNAGPQDITMTQNLWATTGAPFAFNLIFQGTNPGQNPNWEVVADGTFTYTGPTSQYYMIWIAQVSNSVAGAVSIELVQSVNGTIIGLNVPLSLASEILTSATVGDWKEISHAVVTELNNGDTLQAAFRNTTNNDNLRVRRIRGTMVPIPIDI